MSTENRMRRAIAAALDWIEKTGIADNDPPAYLELKAALVEHEQASTDAGIAAMDMHVVQLEETLAGSAKQLILRGRTAGEIKRYIDLALDEVPNA